MIDQLVIIPPDRRKHKEAVYDLASKCFSEGWGYYGFLRYCRQRYFEHSFYDWDASRIGLIGDQIVTHFGVWGYRMRIGATAVRTAGVGAVVTHADLRRRRLMSATATACIDAMSQAGYDMSILFGRRDFYHWLGYVRAWSPTKYFVEASDLPTDQPVVKPRKFAPGSRHDLDSLYNREYARHTGTAVRPTHLRNQYPGLWQGHLWANRRGQVGGYVLTQLQRKQGTLRCVENCGDVEQVLRVLGMLCRKWHLPEALVEDIPYDHPLAQRLRRTNCRMEMTYVKSGGAMVRTVNLRSTLTKIAGELAKRLRASYLNDWRGRLLIADPREKVMLAIDRSKVSVVSSGRDRGGRVKHAIRGGEHVAQLLIGTDRPEEIVEAGRIRLTGEARKLVGAMFPQQHPMLGLWDRY